VIAPTSKVTFMTDGSTQLDKGGEWQTFHPKYQPQAEDVPLAAKSSPIPQLP
jgi:hypothetical protein